MKLFDNIKSKIVQTATNVVTNVGNVIDRDKSMPGVQLMRGGLANNISNNVKNWQAQNRVAVSPGGSLDTRFRQSPTAQTTADTVQGLGSGIVRGQLGFTGLEKKLPEYFQSAVSYQPQTTPGKIANVAGGILGYSKLGVGQLLNPLEDKVASKIGLKKVAENAPQLEKILNTFTRKAIPAVMAESASSAPLALVEALASGRPIQEVFPEQLSSGLMGRALGAGLVYGGMKAMDMGKITKDVDLAHRGTFSGNEIDNILKPVKESDLAINYKNSLENVLKGNSIDETIADATKNNDVGSILSKADRADLSKIDFNDKIVRQLPRRPANSIYVTPDGVAFKVSKQPKTNFSLDKILRDVEESTRSQNKATVESILSLPPPNKPVGLLPPPERSVTTSQLKKLVEQGDNLQGVKFIAKNAKEARTALNIGLPATQIEIANILKPGGILFDESGDLIKKLSDDGGVPLGRTAKAELKQADLPTTGWLKKTYHNLQTQTPQRLKAVFGDEVYSKNLEPILGDLDRASHEADNFIKNGLTKVGDKAKELGITNKSKDIDLIRNFEDGAKGYQKVVDQVGESRAKDLKELYDLMRSEYDTMYETLSSLAESVGKKLPKRANFLSKQTSKSGLDLTKGGVTGESSASIFKKQKAGDVNPMDAYALYLNRSANLFLEPYAKEFEKIKKALAKNPNATPEMLKELQRVSDEITGAGKEISGAQEFFNSYMNLTKQSAVLGKFSTAANQVLGIAPGVANAGVKNTIAGILDPEVRKAVKEQSALYSSVNKNVPDAFRDGNFFTKTKNFFSDTLAAANRFGYEVPLMGFVKQAQQGGAKIDESVIKAADAEAARVLGDRRAWMTPAFYNTFLGKILAPFTQEQTAQAASFLQNIGDKKAGKVLTYLIMTKLVGEAWEKVSGYNPYFDPAGAIQDSAEYFVGSDKKEQNKLKAFMRLAEEGLTLTPPVQSIINQAYSVGESFDFLPESNKVFANDRTWMSTGSLLNPFSNISFNKTDDGVKVQPRPVTGNTPVDFMLNVGAKYIPGVEQFNRTTQAANTLRKGYAETRGGSPTFLAPDTVPEVLKALSFGQSSTKNAQEFYNNDFAPYLTKNQRTAFEASPNKVGYLKSVQPSNERINKTKGLNKMLEKGNTKDVEKILAGDRLFEKPTTQKEADANKSVFNELMASGQTMNKEDINLVLFNGNTVKDKSIKNRKDTFKKLNQSLDNEYYTDQQKRDIIEASGATPEQYEYYRYASMTNDEKLEELLPQLGDLSDPENFTKLAIMRAKLAGGQGLTPGMIDYLYQDGLISKTQQQLLNALEYDEQKQEFYIKRDSKFGSGSGGSKISYKQALKLYKLDLPSLNSNKSAHYSFTPSSNLIGNILSKRAVRAKLR